MIAQRDLGAVGIGHALALPVGIGIRRRSARHELAQRRQQDLVGGELQQPAARTILGARRKERRFWVWPFPLFVEYPRNEQPCRSTEASRHPSPWSRGGACRRRS